MANSIKKWILILVLVGINIVGYSQNFPSQQNPPKLVNDFAKILTPEQTNVLERKLVNFFDTTSTQIAVVTINSIDGMDVSAYATELAHRWGIGTEGKDNGVLVLVKPKTETSNGETFIAVGYGLEGAIPDVIASRIVREVMIPNFRNSDMFSGIDQAVSLIMGFASGEYSADGMTSGGKSKKSPLFIFLFLMVAFAYISSLFKRKSNTSQTYTNDTATNHIPPIFFGTMFGRSFGSSSNSFGGGSDFGGFGGFGGGGFGGGGAGGSW